MDAERLQEELKMVRKLYPSVVTRNEFSVLLIPDFPLPNGWNVGKTEFMLEIPAGYPTVPPDNLYVTEGLRVKGTGNPPSNYEENQEKLGKKWGRFSWHISGGWHPHADPQRGDNLLTFVLIAKEQLRRLE